MNAESLFQVLSEGLYQLRKSEQLATARGLPGMLVSGKPFTVEHIDALDEALFAIGANLHLQVEYASVCRARGIEPYLQVEYASVCMARGIEP